MWIVISACDVLGQLLKKQHNRIGTTTWEVKTMEGIQLDVSWPLLVTAVVGIITLWSVLTGLKEHELRKYRAAQEETQARYEELERLHFQPHPPQPTHRLKSVG